MSSPYRVEPRGQMVAADTIRFFDILQADGAVLRFAGGCVRDAVQGQYEATDIDFATDALPNRVVRLLQNAGINVALYGMDHGTVTALVSGRPYEITTLRCDVKTYGRRAQVAFTDDWAADAQRRDLTMNALYADRDGRIHDHVGGYVDIVAGRVRFIGAASDRIAEDHLRILRYFRFYASHGKEPPDRSALKSCAALSHLVDSLPGERLWKETSRLLVATAAIPALHLMEQTGVLARLLPLSRDLTRAERLAELENRTGVMPDPVRRLAALLHRHERGVARLAHRLRLSKAESRRLGVLVTGDERVRPDMTERELLSMLYRSGAARFRDLALLQGARKCCGAAWNPAWQDLVEKASDWQAPTFPLNGRDVEALGIDRGPEVGAVLSAVEAWWIDRSFRPDRAACLERLSHLASGQECISGSNRREPKGEDPRAGSQ